MGLTCEQGAIVRDRGRDVLVTAGAGAARLVCSWSATCPCLATTESET